MKVKSNRKKDSENPLASSLELDNCVKSNNKRAYCVSNFLDAVSRSSCVHHATHFETSLQLCLGLQQPTGIICMTYWWRRQRPLSFTPKIVLLNNNLLLTAISFFGLRVLRYLNFWRIMKPIFVKGNFTTWHDSWNGHQVSLGETKTRKHANKRKHWCQ